MPRIRTRFWTMGFVAACLLGTVAPLRANEAKQSPSLPYDLAQIKYIEAFAGSAKAKDLLSQQGVVVTQEQFRQIFEPYKPSMRATLPTFITVDSAWHTYHVLLEEGVQQVELGQARLLRRFSERLYRVAAARQGPAKAMYRDLALFAAVGWAAQDTTCLERLPAEDRRAVAQTIDTMHSGGQALFFGLPLQAGHFRPVGFYTKTPELSRYFVARRWYAVSTFRLKSEAETLRALYLTMLVESDTDLKKFYRQLTKPPTAMVGPIDDPGVVQYAEVASRLAGGQLTEENIPRILNDFRREAAKLPAPRINDQFLSPGQFATRQEETKGMRVFGPSQLPSAILFQNTTEPAITGRELPSGLDVFAAGPLACDAGRRALKVMEPNRATYEAICRTDGGPLPDSLHGHAMQLLRLMQQPLPEAAPLALRTPAWQDKQLSTALGAWAEERHTWVLHSKQTGGVGGGFEESPGYVSPYPKFYRKLGQLARRAADLLPKVAVEPDFAITGREWLEARHPPAFKASESSDEKPDAELEELTQEETIGDLDNRMAKTMYEYFQATGKDIQAASVLDRARAWAALDAAAERCAEGKGVTDLDRRCMRVFASPEGHAAESLPAFAELCDQLAAIADKELAGERLDKKDMMLIMNYGETLASFHFYQGMASMDPRDDFPSVAPVFSNPLRQKALYVGVGRPEAIYVVLFNGKNLVLHRGAVLSYREFPAPLEDTLDDTQWQEAVRTNQAPSPPTWTTSFRCTPSNQQRDLLALEDRPIGGHGTTRVLIERLVKRWQALRAPKPPEEKKAESSDEDWNAEARANELRDKEEADCYRLFLEVLEGAGDEDVPDLLYKLLPATPEDHLWELFDRVRTLNWRPHREGLISLAHPPLPTKGPQLEAEASRTPKVAHNRQQTIGAYATLVLGESPEEIDVQALAKAYDRQPFYVRAEYCYLIGRSKEPGPEGKRVLAAGLRDKSWEVRYQAAAAVALTHASSPEILDEVRAGLDDEHPKAAAAIVHAATVIKLKGAASRMFVLLKEQLEASKLSDTEYREPRWVLEIWDIRSLTAELIAGLGEFRHQPARDAFRAFVFPDSPQFAEYEFGAAAFKALLKLDPKKKEELLGEIFRDPRCPNHMIETAVVEATQGGSIKSVELMLPLFEDVARMATNGQRSPAVWASWHITPILEHADLRDLEESRVFERICDALLRQTRGPAASSALSALRHFDPAAAARESLHVALDRRMSKDARRTALSLIQEAPKPWPIRELRPLLDEPFEKDDFLGSVAHTAAQTIGTFARELDPTVAKEAETLRLVKKTFDDMLKGPRARVAIVGLTYMSEDPQELYLRIASDRSLSYQTRKNVIARLSDWGPECAKKLIPLLSDDSRPDDEKPTIAMCAANSIARMVEKEEWDGEEPAADFIQKAKAWAETVKPK